MTKKIARVERRRMKKEAGEVSVESFDPVRVPSGIALAVDGPELSRVVLTSELSP